MIFSSLKKILKRTPIYRFCSEKINLAREWKTRIADALAAPDNKYISRTKNAGKIKNGVQYMHNDIKIIKGSYYGKNIMRLLKKNKGVHEPQEERVFQEVIKELKQEDSPLILELGAYWGFYSMWFLKECKNGKAYLIEPEEENLNFGKKNFKLNGFDGSFLRGFISSKSNSSNQPPIYTIDDLIKLWQLPKIDILHSDIQGAELEMLMSINLDFLNKNIRYIFVSTHSNDLHRECKNYILGNNFHIIADVSLDETYSHDGILIARNLMFEGIENIDLSKKLC